MNISGLILVLIAIFLIYKIHNDPVQTGGAINQMDIFNKHQDPYYERQYRELDDVDNVLNRPIEKGKENINRLVAKNTYQHGAAEIRNPVKKYLDFIDNMKSKVPDSTKVIVESKQPYFLDEAMIIDHYGKKYYWDWRYPKQPISIDFAKDPENYIEKYPNEYPSYIIKSKDFSVLGPNNDDHWLVN